MIRYSTLPLLSLFLLVMVFLPLPAQAAAYKGIQISKLANDEKFEADLREALLKQFSSAKGIKDLASMMSSNIIRLRLVQWRLLHADVNSRDAIQKIIDQQKEDIATLTKEWEERAKANKKDPTPYNSIMEIKAKSALDAAANGRRYVTNFDEFVKQDDAAKFLQVLSSDLEWMKSAVYSGECIAPAYVLNIMFAIYKQDPSIIRAGRPRDIATAVALEYARFSWPRQKAVARALFYIQNWREGRLNSSFDALPMAQLRCLLGFKGFDAWSSVDSLKWALDNVHVPDAYYAGAPTIQGKFGAACWRASYRLNNVLGDSIHRNYYETYSRYYGTNVTRRTTEVGGVCGALSHLGTVSALGNGVPAVTMGEPGHCAHAFLIHGKWKLCYSLSWQHRLHWTQWNNVYYFSSLQVAYDMFSKEQAARTDISMGLKSAAMVMSSERPKLTIAAYEDSVTTQPLNLPAWIAYFQYLEVHGAAENNLKAIRLLMRILPKQHPETAAYVFRSISKNILLSIPYKQRLEIIAKYWRLVENMGHDRWDMEGFLQAQYDWVNLAGEDEETVMLQMYRAILPQIKGKPDLSPLIMNWASLWAKEQGVEMEQAIASLHVEFLSSKDGGDASILMTNALVGAETSHDMSTILNLKKLVDKKDQSAGGTLPDFDSYKGSLLSDGAVVFGSSTCKFDRPLQHLGLFGKSGGMLTTDRETSPNVIVQLPRMGRLNGIVLIGVKSNLQDLCIEVSESGGESDWEEVKNVSLPKGQRVIQVDLKESKPRALYIRVTRKLMEKDHFQLNGIYVYGDKVA